MSSNNEYFTNPEKLEEMYRLKEQDRYFTQKTGLLPHGINKPHTYLDIACGTGGQALELARLNSEMSIHGMDLSRRMIDFCKAQAISNNLNNVSFEVGDATKPLPYQDASMDFVNARLINGFMNVQTWPVLLSEAWRVLSMGGTIRLVEGDIRSISSSVALESFGSRIAKSFFLAGKLTSEYAITIFPQLIHFLRDAHFSNITSTHYAINFAYQEEGYDYFKKQIQGMFEILPDFLLRTGTCTQEELHDFQKQIFQDVNDPSFVGFGFMHSVTAIK